MPWLPKTGYAIAPLSRGPASGSLRPREVCALHSRRGVGTATFALAGLPGAGAFGLIGLLGQGSETRGLIGSPTIGLLLWEGEGHSCPESEKPLGPPRATHNGPRFPELYCWQISKAAKGGGGILRPSGE